MFESNPNILSNPGSQQDGPSLAADPAGQARMLHEWVKLSPLPMALIQYPDGVILATNQLLSELLGLSEEQMLGRTPLELGLFDDPKQREKVIRGVLARSKPVSLELKIPISSGELLDIQAWIRHTRLQDKEYLLLTLANQTEAKQTEAALRISEKKFALAFRLTPDAVAISEMATGKLIEVNASFERQFGWSVSEAIGRSTSELNIWAEPNDRQRLIDSIKTKTPDGIECQGRSRDGSIRLYQLMAETFDLKGTSILVTTMRDISQQRQQEIKLRESEERLNQAMQTAKLGYWDAELDPPHFFASARGAALHGLPEEPMHGNMNQFMQNIIPADRLRIEKQIEEYASGKINELQIIYGIRMPDDSLRHVESTSRLYRTANGQEHRITGILRDVSDRFQYQQKLKASEEKFTALFQASMEPCCVGLVQSGVLLEINQQFTETFGWTPADVIGKSPDEYAFWTGLESIEEVREFIAQHDVIRNYPMRFRHKQGHTLQCLCSSRKLQIDGQTVVTVTMHDISAQIEAEMALRASQDKFSRAFHSSPDAITIVDLNTNCYLEVNEGFTRVSGYTASDVIGKKYHEIGIWSTAEQLEKLYTIFQRDGRIRNQEVLGHHKNGSSLTLSISIEFFELNGVPCLLTTSRDISDMKSAEARIEHMAYHDPLTNLPNRTLLTDRLNQQIPLLKRHRMRGALLYMDLDHFKRINDSLGHAAGDSVLKRVATCLEKAIRAEDTAARLGGDEFVVLLNAIEGDLETAKQDALALAEKLSILLAEPMQLDGKPLLITPSIGIALIPDHGEDPGDLLKHADIALYRAKDAGRNTIKVYHPSMLEEINERLLLEDELRAALERNEFELNYQPQVDNRTGRIIGVEALLRWRHPSLGQQSPAQFIHILEESRQIVGVGYWVLEEACRCCAALLQERLIAPEHFNLAVNISAEQFAQADFVQRVFDILEKFAVPATLLKLEVTESIVIKDMEGTIEKMQLLQARGINFALDDFGTGYSSLTYLKRLPVNVLKIDQSFIRDVTTNPSDAEITRTIIAMAASMNLSVIAEGVEREEQLDFITRAGCHVYQGFLFSVPVGFAALRQLLQQ